MYNANEMHWLWFYIYMYEFMHAYMHSWIHYWILRKTNFGHYILYIFGMYKVNGIHWLLFYMYVYAFINAYMHKYIQTWMHYDTTQLRHNSSYILYIFRMYKANVMHLWWFTCMCMHLCMHRCINTYIHGCIMSKLN